MITTITGTVLTKGMDSLGTFITIRHKNKYGLHETEFEIPTEDAELYHVGQIATMTMEWAQ